MRVQLSSSVGITQVTFVRASGFREKKPPQTVLNVCRISASKAGDLLFTFGQLKPYSLSNCVQMCDTSCSCGVIACVTLCHGELEEMRGKIFPPPPPNQRIFLKSTHILSWHVGIPSTNVLATRSAIASVQHGADLSAPTGFSHCTKMVLVKLHDESLRPLVEKGVV